MAKVKDLPFKVYKLNSFETSGLALSMNGVGVMNVFNVTDELSAKKSYDNMRLRATQILEQNVWLMGRLDRGFRRPTALHVYENDMHPERYVKELTGDQYFQEDLLETLEPLFEYQIEKASDCLKHKKPLTVFYFVKNNDFSKFGVFLSISHVIADGATLYTLFNMLNENSVVEPMSREYLNHQPCLKRETSLGLENGKTVAEAQMPLLLKSILYKSYARKKFMNTTRRIQVLYYDFDMEKVAEMKEKYTKNDEFVSTNDVLHYWLSTLNPKNDRTQMAVNLRPRISALSALTAGNYEDLHETKLKDQTDPLAVRRSLQRALSPGGFNTLPKFKQMKKFMGSMTTNWGSFFQSWKVEGAELDQQIPMMDIRKSALGFKILGVRFTCEENCVLVQRKPGQYAAFIYTASGAVSKEKLDNDPMMKKCLFHCDPFKEEL